MILFQILLNKIMTCCIGLGLNGRWSFGAGSNGQRWTLRLVMSPGLKSPPWSTHKIQK